MVCYNSLFYFIQVKYDGIFIFAGSSAESIDGIRRFTLRFQYVFS